MTSREKFEQAIKARFGDSIDYRVCKNGDGGYMAWDMQVAWWAWQAAETDMAVQLANAESKCRELAAENAALNKFITQSCYVFDGEQHEISDAYICATDGGMPETTASDALLAEVRAQGVDAAIEHMSKLFGVTDSTVEPLRALEWLAQALRKQEAAQ